MTTETTEVVEIKTERQLAQEASAIAAGLPPTPPSPIEEAAKFKAQQKAKRDLADRIDKYDTLSDREKFDTAVEASTEGIIKEGESGFIPEGSEFVSGREITYDPSMTPKEIADLEKRLKIKPRGWGYYTPEQVAEIATAKIGAKRKAKEVVAFIGRSRRLAQERFEATHTKIPGVDAEGKVQWIDNKQLADLKVSSPKIYTALTTKGIEAANQLIKNRNEAIRRLDADYRVAIPPELPVGVDAVTGAKIEHGHDVVKYLRDNPGQTALLITAGYDAKAIASLDKATVATKKYWTPDGNLDVYAAYIAGIDPKHLKTLTDKTEKEIKGLPPSLRGFEQSYAVTFPIPDYPLPKKFWPSLTRMKAWGERDREVTLWHKEAGSAYAKIYGREALSNAANIELATYAFAPARALEPRVKLKDITTLEWVIGAIQIALYTAPLWVPKVARVLKPLSKLERSARTAGNAKLQVNIAREEMLARAWNNPNYVKFASDLQHEIQASMKADRIFLDKLAALNKMSPQQLVSVGKLSGIKGLADSIKGVGVARTLVVKAWNVIEKSKYYTNPTTTAQITANESYLAKLGVLQTAQNNLANALAKASGVLTPAYQLAPMAGWQNVIANTQREIARLNTEMARTEAIIDKGGLPSTIREAREYWLEVRSQLASAKGRLSTYKTASAAGKTPPIVSSYRIVDKTPTQLKMDRYDATQKKLDDYFRGIGKPRPTPAGGVATMERTLTAVETPRGIMEVGFRPQYAIVKPEVAVPTPTVITPAPVAGVGVLPALAGPQIQVTTRTTTQKVPISRILTMTPEQAQRIYGDEMQITEAVSPFIIPTKAVKPAQWLSPTQAIKAAQRIAVESYTRQITQSAIKQAELLKIQGATQAAVRSATKQAIQSQVKVIEAIAIKSQVLKAVKTGTVIKQIVATGIVPTPPVTKVSPVVPITITPILLSGRQMKGSPLTKKERKLAVAWPQGFGWWIVFMRGGKRFRFFHHGQQPPRGIKQVKQGEGEAARGIQQHKGVAPVSFKLPMGAVDVRVESPGREPGRVGAIGFTPTGISASKPQLTPPRPRITPKRGRI